MSQKEQEGVKAPGKIDDRKRRFYGDLDLSNLNYLEHRDMTRVAEEHNTDINKVSKVKRLVVRNSEIMASLLKRGGDRRKTMEQASA